eukprot:6188847-Pleurochrysis_carterae.AAC.1
MCIRDRPPPPPQVTLRMPAELSNALEFVPPMAFVQACMRDREREGAARRRGEGASERLRERGGGEVGVGWASERSREGKKRKVRRKHRRGKTSQARATQLRIV